MEDNKNKTKKKDKNKDKKKRKTDGSTEAIDGEIDLIIIWFGNLIGTMIVGLSVQLTKVGENLTEKAQVLCETKLNDNLISIFILSAFCGLLMFVARIIGPLGGKKIGIHVILHPDGKSEVINYDEKKGKFTFDNTFISWILFVFNSNISIKVKLFKLTLVS